MPVNSVIALPSTSILSPPWMPSSPNHVPLNRLCWCCFIKSYPLNQMPCLRIWVCGFVYKRYLVNADRWLQPAFPFLLFLLVSVYLTLWTSITGIESLGNFWNSSFHIPLSLCTIAANFVASVFTFPYLGVLLWMISHLCIILWHCFAYSSFRDIQNWDLSILFSFLNNLDNHLYPSSSAQN